MRIAVFAYNFPHKKTQDFLFRLFLEKADVRLVVAADPVELNIPTAAVRTKLRFGALCHPRAICERFGWRYEVVDHNSVLTAQLLREERIDIGIVSGARVLKNPVVSTPSLGIVNFHPGLLPEVRGLDAMQWSLHEGHPIGVTAHLIDERVDAGRILIRHEVRLYANDTVFDVAQRLQDTQTELLPKVLLALTAGQTGEPVQGKFMLHRKMLPELERQVPKLLEERLARLFPASSVS